MRSTLLTIFFCSTLSCHSQNFFTSVFAGVGNYSGELQERPYSLAGTNAAWGLGLLFELNENMLIRADFTTGSVSGSDARGINNRSRNLSFISTITEFSIGYEYVLFDLYQYKVSPYVFINAGVFRFSPYIKDENGGKVSLYEYDTEGQGFYQDRKKYKLSQFCIPFGAGVQTALSRNARVGFVVGIRKIFTDYLDDVSTTYVDKDLLTANRGLKSVRFAYRGAELPNGDPYPQDGTKRGNPNNNDMYYFVGASLRFRFESKARSKDPLLKRRKASMECPRFF